MINIVTDPSKKIRYYFRVNSTPLPKTITFLDENGDPYPVNTKTWEVNIKLDEWQTTNVLQLVSGFGLTIGVNSIQIAPTAEQLNIQAREYFIEFRNVTDSQSWFTGVAVGHNGEFDNFETDDLTITVLNAVDVVSSATSANIYAFANINSDVSGYKQLLPLGQFVVGALGETSATVATTETLIEEFVTNLGYPNIVTIPIGEIVIHYDTIKSSGAQSYYSYAKIFKRAINGIETPIGTSDTSTALSINTQESVNVTVEVSSVISLLPSDRLVVKVYAIMLNTSATISVRYDDATGARIEIPVAINLSPRVSTVVSTSTLTANISLNDCFEVTNQNSALLIANPTGSIGNFEGFMYRLTGTGAITYENKFRAFGSPLPANLTSGKTLYLICIYNATDDVYDTASREEV